MNYIFSSLIGITLISSANASGGKAHSNSAPAQKRSAHSASNKNHSNLRKTRQTAPKRQLFIGDWAGFGTPAVNSLFQIPSEIFNNFVGAASGVLPDQFRGLAGLGLGTPNQLAQQGVEEVADRAKTFADTGFDVFEHFANGVAQKGRDAIDRATARAAGLIDSSLLIGTSSLGAGVEAARGFQNEAKKFADVAQATVRAGENAFSNTFDRVNNVARGGFASAELPNKERTNPVNSIFNIASII